MSFLELLSGKKKEDIPNQDLEIPPAPPTAKDLPKLPPLNEINEQPEAPPIENINQDMEEVEEELEERDDLEPAKPIFLHLNQFKDILDEAGLIKNILKENDDALVRVTEFKDDQDKEFKKWDELLKDAQKKLIYADKTLFSTKR